MHNLGAEKGLKWKRRSGKSGVEKKDYREINSAEETQKGLKGRETFFFLLYLPTFLLFLGICLLKVLIK